METVQPCFYQWVHSDTSVRTIFCHSIGWCKACARTPTISIHERRFRYFTSSHCYGTTVFDFMHKNSPYNQRRNPDSTRSETYFRQDLFPAYLFFRRQFHAIVIFRLKSISDLDSGSLSNFFLWIHIRKIENFHICYIGMVTGHDIISEQLAQLQQHSHINQIVTAKWHFRWLSTSAVIYQSISCHRESGAILTN